MAMPPLKIFREIKQKFSDLAALEEITLATLKSIGSKGAKDDVLNQAVAKKLEIETEYAFSVISIPEIQTLLKVARENLKEKNLIGYAKNNRVWYPQRQPIRDLTPKEQLYFKSKGFGPGWRKIRDKQEIVNWIYNSLTPLEFENLCVAILNEHCRVQTKITEKHPKSGADGGFDGIGEIEIDGVTHPFALQVKKYAPNKQIGHDHCERFIGALLRRKWRHGFIITSAIFSDRAKECIADFSEQDVLIELIDQERLIEIMLLKNDQPHGFGVHKSDYGLLYLNETNLKKASAGTMTPKKFFARKKRKAS